jgi:hypothetical protein
VECHLVSHPAQPAAQGIYSQHFFPSFLGWRTMCTRQGLLGSRIQIDGRLAQSPTREKASNWKFFFWRGGRKDSWENRNDRVRASPFLGVCVTRPKVWENRREHISRRLRSDAMFFGGWPRGMGERVVLSGYNTPVPMGDGEGERSGPRFPEWECPGWRKSYLVDPASSHMLVSKIKPCMCKYKLFCTVKLRMAH